MLAAAGLVAVAVLSGCAPTVNLEPAEQANAPECANMIVRLPDTVAELPARNVNSQATAAYGSPTAVIIRCGVNAQARTCCPVSPWMVSTG